MKAALLEHLMCVVLALGAAAAKTLVEAIYATAGINRLLLACEERMTL